MLPFFIGVMAVGTDSLILSALLDPMAREYGMIGPQAGRAAAAQGVALAVTAPVTALLFGRHPGRTLMLAGLVLLATAALSGALTGAAGSWEG